jgi:predicted DNA-binding transcriptional regulator AlpA
MKTNCADNKAPEDKLLRKREAAAILACSLRTVDRLVNVGKLTRVPILGGIRFRLSQVQLLMNGGNHDFQG